MPNFQHAQGDYLSHYQLYKAKSDGVTTGGFYQDAKGGKWLIKESHRSGLKAEMTETLAGGVYSLLLGNKAPEIKVIFDDSHGQNSEMSLLTASKLLPNFKSIADSLGYFTREYTTISEHFGGKPVHGFLEAMAATAFMGDNDAHWGNTGLIDKGTHYDFTKIDYGLSFRIDGETDLGSINVLTCLFFEKPLSDFGYKAVYEAVNKIASIDFASIEQAIEQKISKIGQLIQDETLPDMDSDFDNFYSEFLALQGVLENQKHSVLQMLKNQHHSFKDIANHLVLEEAIINHDALKLNDILNTGEVSLFDEFTPLIFANTFYSAKSTGYDLIQSYWPNINNEITIGYPTPIDIDPAPYLPAPNLVPDFAQAGLAFM